MEFLYSKKSKTKDDESEDAFTKLPDVVLLSVLSHLTRREAARMSVLSQRWRNLWNLIVVSTLTLKSSDMEPDGRAVGLPVDWISELSDDVLISILSRLSLPEAARTSVLSRRWKNLWRSMMRWSLSLTSNGVD